MRIKTLTLNNFACYRGESVLELEDKTYAIIAETEGNPDRSNWAGKTTILESITFALFGRHRYRFEDDFITRGESSGGVKVELSDGTVIERHRKRDQSTRLSYEGATQKEAQLAIEQALGFTESDFLATCYFEQKQTSKFITCKPDDRLTMVSGWFGLEKLEKAEAELKNRTNDTIRKLQALEMDRRAKQERLATITENIQIDSESLTAQIKQAAERVEIARSEVEAWSTIRTRDRLQSDFARKVEDGKGKATERQKYNLETLAEELPALKTIEKEAAVTKELASQELSSRKRVHSGTFNGQCPVAGIQCPATATINGDSLAAKKRLDDASKALEDAENVWHQSADALKIKERDYTIAARLESELTYMRKDVKEIRERINEIPENTRPAKTERELNQEINELLGKIESNKALLNQAKNSEKQAVSVREEITKIDEELAELNERLSVFRVGGTIFGKNGLQRRLAENALGHIQTSANQMLQGCGVDLSVDIQWSRAGKGLSSNCEVCGFAFGTSAKNKSCPQCQSTRGPKLIHSLDVALSDTSGAAEDLGGASIQLAASAWLRRSRLSPWSTVLIDEPFSACDKSNRKNMNRAFASMLKSDFGFEQAFVISHTPDTDVYGGKILIQSDGSSSRAKVMA